MNQVKFNHSVRKATAIAILFGVLLSSGCAPSRKTGTVTDSGTVNGFSFPKDGGRGQVVVELAVKLDDGKTINAIWMVDQGSEQSMKDKRVEVEPSDDANMWKVIRVLN